MKIYLHIDRLMVEGAAFNPSEREQLGAALQARLTELLLDAPDGHGLLAGANVAQLATRPIPLAGHPEPRALGKQVGDTVGAMLCGDFAESNDRRTAEPVCTGSTGRLEIARGGFGTGGCREVESVGVEE